MDKLVACSLVRRPSLRFSTFAVTEANLGRLTFVFDAAPPIVVLAIDKLVRNEWSPVTSGCVIGLLFALQLFTSEELLTVSALLLLLSLVVIAIGHHAEVMRRGAEIVRAVVAAAATFMVLSIYPLVVQFTGPDRITGPPQPKVQLAMFSSDLFSPVVPSVVQWATFGWANRISGGFSAATAGELTEYVGLPLLVLLVLIVVVLRSRMLVRVFGVVALSSFILSMGPRLLVNSAHTGVPLPDAILAHLPIVNDIIPSRFALAFWFALAVLLGLGLDVARAAAARTLAQRANEDDVSRAGRLPVRHRAARLGGALVILLAVGALLPLVPDWPYAQMPADVPAFFTDGAVRAIPLGSLVGTYPYPVTSMAWPMLWQAESGMRYRMLGGYAITPDAQGAGTFFGDPSLVGYCFVTIFESGKAPNWLCNAHQLEKAVRSLGVTTFVVGQGQPYADIAAATLGRALHGRPLREGGVLLWRCVPHSQGGSRWT